MDNVSSILYLIDEKIGTKLIKTINNAADPARAIKTTHHFFLNLKNINAATDKTESTKNVLLPVVKPIKKKTIKGITSSQYNLFLLNKMRYIVIMMAIAM